MSTRRTVGTEVPRTLGHGRRETVSVVVMTVVAGDTQRLQRQVQAPRLRC
jgi:hypothetical protein